MITIRNYWFAKFASFVTVRAAKICGIKAAELNINSTIPHPAPTGLEK